jgi:hypothetical protein
MATVKAISTQDATKSGSTSITITTPAAASGSVVIMTTPVDGGPANGPWQIVVSAINGNGVPSSDLPIVLTSTEGTLSSGQGETNSNGIWTAMITPPSSYEGEPVAVSATAESQTAAVNIVFAPTVFNPSFRREAAAKGDSSSTTGSSSAIQPIAYGTSGNTASTNPFAAPNTCFSSVALGSLVPASCQTAFTQTGISVKAESLVNAACRAAGVLNGISGVLDCAGTVLSVSTCLTGVGAEVCVGGLIETAPGCVAYLAPMIPTKFTQSPAFRTGMDIVAMGIQPNSPGLTDYVGLLCDDLGLPDSGTGSSGTTVTVTSPGSSTTVGTQVQLTSSVTGNSNSTVEWAINGVPLASGNYGTITSTGLYTAPTALPNPAKISITATSQADSTASGGAAIQVLLAPAGTISTVAGNGSAGYSGDGSAATSAQLNAPSGVAFDGNGNMFIADYVNNAVRRVDSGTGIITTIAGTGLAGYSGDGGPGTVAQLNGPSHVAFDRTTNLYITDAGNERIRKVDALTDQIVTVAGDGNSGSSGDGGPAINAELNYPDGIALDSDGNVYIGDALNNRVRELTIATASIATVAGNGAEGYSGDGGLAVDAELDFPSRPFIDPAGNTYIADYQNNRIRKVNASTGIITTIVGTGMQGYAGDGGLAISAELNGPLSLALDSSGVLYIADTGNQRIRAVNTTANTTTVLGVSIPAGTIATVVGTGVGAYQGDGGPATSAQINSPTGLTFDLQGNLIFADANNNAVRKVIASH